MCTFSSFVLNLFDFKTLLLDCRLLLADSYFILFYSHTSIVSEDSKHVKKEYQQRRFVHEIRKRIKNELKN